MKGELEWLRELEAEVQDLRRMFPDAKLSEMSTQIGTIRYRVNRRIIEVLEYERHREEVEIVARAMSGEIK